MGALSKLLANNHIHRPKIAVFGDCLVDEYYKVDVKRISPEAPTPVMLSKDDKPSYVLPGGAANVALQLRHWNVDCVLFGLMSSVDYGIYDRCGIIMPKCYFGERLVNRVPRKIRFQDHQNVIRWDIERENYGEDIECSLDSLILSLEYYLEKEKLDVVILSDYGKGLFNNFKKTQDIITLCHSHGVKIIVDPKDGPIEKWVGCTYFKPNSIEAERFTGVQDANHQCQILAEKLQANIVVTHGGKGVAALSDKLVEYKPKKKVNIQNFSGAGDCFAGFFGLAIAHNFNLEECVEIAYEAGAKYVQRNHNSPVHPLELYENKFANIEDLKTRNFKLVATNGCYDLLHAGHISTFEFAKAQGDKLLVLINSDESVQTLKGSNRPIVPLSQRMKAIAALECVDYVVSFNETSPSSTIKSLGGVEVLVKGADWQGKKIRSAEFAKEVCFAPSIEGLSTTQIIEKIKKL